MVSTFSRLSESPPVASLVEHEAPTDLSPSTITPSPGVSEFSQPLEPLWSRLSVSRAFDRFTFCLDIIFGVGRGRDGIAAGSLTSRGRFPLFCNLSQCVSQQSILSDFIFDGCSNPQSESGLDLLARWCHRFSAMSVHGIRP